MHAAKRVHSGRQLVVGTHLPELGLEKDVRADVDVGPSELNENVGVSRIEIMQQAERQHVRIDHARSHTLTERSEKRRKMREARLS